MRAVFLLMLLITAGCTPVRQTDTVPDPEFGTRVSGFIGLQGHGVRLPPGSWLVAAADRIDGQNAHVVLTTTDNVDLTGVVELTDLSAYSTASNPPVSPVCSSEGSLAVQHLIDMIPGGPGMPYDCIRPEAGTGGTEYSESASASHREPGRRLVEHGVVFPATEVTVVVAFREPT